MVELSGVANLHLNHTGADSVRGTGADLGNLHVLELSQREQANRGIGHIVESRLGNTVVNINTSAPISAVAIQLHVAQIRATSRAPHAIHGGGSVEEVGRFFNVIGGCGQMPGGSEVLSA